MKCFAFSLKVGLLALTFLLGVLAHAQVREDDAQIAFHLADKAQVKKIYDSLNIKETWLRNPTGGKYLAKVYQDPTGTVTLRCDMFSELRATCDIEIKKICVLKNIKCKDEGLLFSAELYDKDVVTGLWDTLNVVVFEHGGLYNKVLANDLSNFSIFCIYKDADASYAVCKAQIIR